MHPSTWSSLHATVTGRLNAHWLLGTVQPDHVDDPPTESINTTSEDDAIQAPRLIPAAYVAPVSVDDVEDDMSGPDWQDVCMRALMC